MWALYKAGSWKSNEFLYLLLKSFFGWFVLIFCVFKGPRGIMLNSGHLHGIFIFLLAIQRRKAIIESLEGITLFEGRGNEKANIHSTVGFGSG